MDEITKRRIIRIALDLWRALKGSLHYRFAVFLVGTGAIFLVGPPVFVFILLHIFEISVDQLGYEINPFWENATKFIGVTLVVVGVWLFLRGERLVRPPRDSFDFRSPDGWSFEQVVRTIARRQHVEFVGFLPSELEVKMPRIELAVDDALDAIAVLRERSGSHSVPAFDVALENSIVVVRKKNAHKD